MKRLSYPLLIIILLAAFNSCQKEYIPDDVDLPTTVIPGDSALLSRYVELDTTASAIYDTLLVATYTYDAQQRMVISTNRSEFDAAGIPGFSHIYRYYYNGADTLPYKVTEITRSQYNGIVNDYLDTAYLTYSSMGQLIKDSILEHDVTGGDYSVGVQKLIYQQSTLISSYDVRNISGPSAPATYSQSDTFQLTMTNGNVTQQKQTMTSPTGEVSTELITVSYDNKVNPFSKAQKMLNLYPIFSTEMGPINVMQKNNPLTFKSVFTWPGGPPVEFDRSFVYTYGSNNLPATVLISGRQVGNPVAAFWGKGYYFYTK